MKTLAECYYGNTRVNAHAIYNTICIGDNFPPYIRQFSTIYTTIFHYIYDNFRPHIRQFSTKIFVHISKPDYLFLPDLFAFGKRCREKIFSDRLEVTIKSYWENVQKMQYFKQFLGFLTVIHSDLALNEDIVCVAHFI